ncbi:uncharacterized protein LOC124352545 isoform X2 [Daphnia pulicaria]|uniref:uncharacterized protein LOC124352545 isoform X2 n=1 Tax=Daphnia pulicaria TaxID=35523 RepID=UPI001EE9DEAB|nr:uncharacterized protein LOC124352545 isoform X2 [Daphnia pulicaria]
MTALVGTHGYVNPLYAESSTYRRAGQFACPSRLKVAGNITLNCQCGGVEVGPIPSNVNLKKERPVCISFTLEGHGDHNVKRVMRRRRGWVRTTRVTSLSSSKLWRRAAVGCCPQILHHRHYNLCCTSCITKEPEPIPSNVNLQKERPVLYVLQKVTEIIT